jgi:hypothetical protein
VRENPEYSRGSSKSKIRKINSIGRVATGLESMD